MDNPLIQPVGMWWGGLWRSSGLDGADLLVIHATTGVIWASVYTLYVLFRLRSVSLPFMKEVTQFSPTRDATWLVRKTLTLSLGEKFLKKRGIDPTLPDQGFYNAGQKMFAVPAVLGSIGLVVTGIILLLSRPMPAGEAQTVVLWAIMVHVLCAFIVALGLPVHIYMATLAPGEGPAFRSMLTGMVPEWFAKHHNRLWYNKIKNQETKA